MTMKRFLNMLLCCALNGWTAHAFPEGAPVTACEDMTPQHMAPPQSIEPPYAISYLPNEDGTYQVILQRTSDTEYEDFRGFFIQARSDSTGSDALGVFTFEDNGLIQSRPCPGSAADNGVTHTSSVDLKSYIEVTWDPAENGDVDGVYFVATVVLNAPTFWIDIRSPVLK